MTVVSFFSIVCVMVCLFVAVCILWSSFKREDDSFYYNHRPEGEQQRDKEAYKNQHKGRMNAR